MEGADPSRIITRMRRMNEVGEHRGRAQRHLHIIDSIRIGFEVEQRHFQLGQRAHGYRLVGQDRAFLGETDL